MNCCRHGAFLLALSAMAVAEISSESFGARTAPQFTRLSCVNSTRAIVGAAPIQLEFYEELVDAVFRGVTCGPWSAPAPGR